MTSRTLGEDLRTVASQDPERPAVICPERTLSYGELDQLADRAAAGLAKLGVRRGDRVALVLPNDASAAIAIYGTLRAGAAFCPLNPTVKRDRLAYVLDDCDVAAVVCDEKQTPDVHAAAAHAHDRPIVGDVEAFAAEEGAPAPRPPIDLDLAGVIYTSGSTGTPKGVTVTHGNMTFTADSIVEYLEMVRSDRILCVLPLSFGYGLYQLLTCVRVGATLVLEKGIPFPGRIVQLLEEERITGMPGVPTVFQVLVSLKGLSERELPTLRYLTNAGAAMPTSTVAAVRRTFPRARLYLMYGLTECQRVAYLPPEEVDRLPDSVGVPIPGTEAWVEDEEGNALGPEETGELMVRGAHVMQHYWGDPEGTAGRLGPGRWPWERTLRTGDLFQFDREGYLHFVGRRDDMIKSRGEKVMPREIEDVLYTARGVREAVVVGVADELLGQSVCGHVAPEAGQELDPAELRRYCAEHLEEHKVPQRIEIHAELPRTSNGKLDRRALAGS